MIRVEDDGDVRTVTLARPERRNAVTPAGLEALADVVTVVVDANHTGGTSPFPKVFAIPSAT